MWVLATGYMKIWKRLYRAEEAMIKFAPREKVLASALYDESRLEGSDITNRDDLLSKLRKAVVAIDPGAHKYLKSAPAIAPPPALSIGTTALPGGKVATDYCTPLSATGGVPPYTWTIVHGAIPDGIALSTTGLLRGTPTSDGHGSFTVQLTDSAGGAVEKYFDLLISGTRESGAMLAISTTAELPPGRVDADYSERLFATGGTPPYRWAVDPSDKPPDGLILASSGVLNGKPSTAKTFEFGVKVTDSSGNSELRKFTLIVKPSQTPAAESVRDRRSEMNARGVLSDVRHSLNEYRGSRWNGLIVARNRLLATFTLTAMIVFALLAIAIMSGAEKTTVVAATVFYLVGAVVGLCNRLRSESQAESAIEDYGLSAARLITVPLFSGLGAIGGLMFMAYLPFATPVVAPASLPLTIATTGLPKYALNKPYMETKLAATGGRNLTIGRS